MAGPSTDIQVIDLDDGPSSSPGRVTFVDLTAPEVELDTDDEVILVCEKSVIPRPRSKKKKNMPSAGLGQDAPVAPPPEPPSPSGVRCPICLERKDSELCAPACGHILCSTCVARILNQRGPVCPICRKKMYRSRILKLHSTA